MAEYPATLVPAGHIEPVPRRIRALIGSVPVVDTLRARYLWEHPRYPQYYLPLDDFDASVLVDEQHEGRLSRGLTRRYGFRVGDVERPKAMRVYVEPTVPELAGLARVEWDAVDAWFEEDEEVFVHPRSPYTRVDALRSSRTVRVEIDGVVLAESSSTVTVFETGLPTRYYFDPLDVRRELLAPTDTVTACPYKGTTGGYWTATVNGREYPDICWMYRFPTRQLLPIAGLVAFYDEKVDVYLGGVLQARPVTPFSDRR